MKKAPEMGLMQCWMVTTGVTGPDDGSMGEIEGRIESRRRWTLTKTYRGFSTLRPWPIWQKRTYLVRTFAQVAFRGRKTQLSELLSAEDR